MDIFAKNLRNYRTAQGYSQAHLAEKADITTNYIGLIEKKKRFPSPDIIDRIATALGIDAIELFSNEKKMPEAIKTYRKAIIKDIKTQIGRYLEEKLADLE